MLQGPSLIVSVHVGRPPAKDVAGGPLGVVNAVGHDKKVECSQSSMDRAMNCRANEQMESNQHNLPDRHRHLDRHSANSIA